MYMISINKSCFIILNKFIHKRVIEQTGFESCWKFGLILAIIQGQESHSCSLPTLRRNDQGMGLIIFGVILVIAGGCVFQDMWVFNDTPKDTPIKFGVGLLAVLAGLAMLGSGLLGYLG